MKTLRARVERVDDHLAVDRPRDLDAAVERSTAGTGAHAPVAARVRRAVSARNAGALPESKSFWRSARFARSSFTRGRNVANEVARGRRAASGREHGVLAAGPASRATLDEGQGVVMMPALYSSYPDACERRSPRCSITCVDAACYEIAGESVMSSQEWLTTRVRNRSLRVVNDRLVAAVNACQ